jgi:tetratricopeptide (TPR) repeat protein
MDFINFPILTILYMRIHLLFAISLLMFCCKNSNSPSVSVSENIFKPMIQQEIDYVDRNIEGLRADKGKEWYSGDSIFYTLWKTGAKEELDGNYKKALSYYIAALKTKRYEISSYEVKLSLGRLYIQLNDKDKARKMLLEFKQEAKKDISGDEVEWGLTDEAKEALSRDIEDCDYMLGMIDAR